jgi:hypothetical protein
MATEAQALQVLIRIVVNIAIDMINYHSFFNPLLYRQASLTQWRLIEFCLSYVSPSLRIVELHSLRISACVISFGLFFSVTITVRTIHYLFHTPRIGTSSIKPGHQRTFSSCSLLFP